MKFSELWLREWVNTTLDSDALSNQITMAGLEVDGVEPVSGAFTGVVVGEVVECGQHPNADKLRVTKVNVGGDRLLDIVCGAPNCRQGLKVAVATVGRCCRAISKSKRLSCAVSRLKVCCAPSPNWVFPTITPALLNCRRMRQSVPISANT